MKRCWLCKRIMWPWQRIAWRVFPDRAWYWHTSCHRRLMEQLDAAIWDDLDAEAHPGDVR